LYIQTEIRISVVNSLLLRPIFIYKTSKQNITETCVINLAALAV